MTRAWLSVPVVAVGLGFPTWIHPNPRPKTIPMNPLPALPAAIRKADTLEFAKLAAFTRSATVPVDSERSPFTFGEGRRHSQPSLAPATLTPRAPRREAQPISVPPLPALLGIAEEEGASGLTRTAILEDAGQTPRFARVGELIGDALRITAIEAEIVRVIDGQTGRSFELLLR
ncbi:MAG: hypothetical protein ABIQ52_16750 [Vicinamibacterales bacterium]